MLDLWSARSSALRLWAVLPFGAVERTELLSMTGTELARGLSDAAIAYEKTRDNESLQQLESLARAAAARVRRVGEGTVDHIVLSSILKLIVVNVPSLREVLTQADWRWI